MSEGKIVAHIGCAKCETTYFAVRAVPTGRPGVFTNDTERLEGVSEIQDPLSCKECQEPLVRVSAPKPAAVG
jgi:hypothetical protein